jgi:hypothetical protein
VTTTIPRQADDDQRRADLALVLPAVLLHGGGCRRDVGLGLAGQYGRGVGSGTSSKPRRVHVGFEVQLIVGRDQR